MHHEKFTPNLFWGRLGYVGGRVEIIDDVDTNKMIIFDLEDYALNSLRWS